MSSEPKLILRAMSASLVLLLLESVFMSIVHVTTEAMHIILVEFGGHC